jgi:hypothetical protein
MAPQRERGSNAWCDRPCTASGPVPAEPARLKQRQASAPLSGYQSLRLKNPGPAPLAVGGQRLPLATDIAMRVQPGTLSVQPGTLSVVR